MILALVLGAVGVAANVGSPPDAEISATVDRIAAAFVAASGRGFEGREPKLLKEAAREYHAEITPLPMPWRNFDEDEATAFTPPPTPAKVPNLAHWAWRSGDADWTLALSVIMAAIVQRPDRLLIHTGPLDASARSYSSPLTAAGAEAFACIRDAGAEEIAHSVDPTPDPTGRHPWAEVFQKPKKPRLSKQTFAHISDVMRLHTILSYGGIYLDRDAFLHRKVDHYRWKYDAVLGLEAKNFENDHAANFGCIMGAPNATFFRLFWDGAGDPNYIDLSYRVTWGGWAHDSCRKSYALAIKRPDLVHLDERLLQFPFPGHGNARGDRMTEAMLEQTRRAEVCHMSGFMWNSGRTAQLQKRPSIWGEVMWKNVKAAAELDPPIDTKLRRCMRWVGEKLVNESYMDPKHL